MPPRKSAMSTRRPRRPKRNTTLFDAVQGTVTQSGLIYNLSNSRASKKPLRPDEVLFKRKNAPVRYEEDDYYPAHTKLPADQPLPSGDLANAIHTYMSCRYSQATRSHVRVPWKCMNETALIAMGILMEETARSVLGQTGDLALTEANEADDDDDQIRRRQNEWTMSTQKRQMNSSDEERRRASHVQQPSKSVHDSWTWSDESSSYTSDDTMETD
ncbi:mnd1-like protein [Curvularia clavata]|uniref:Mnd1-like protein n=1 Tax=Curvularia clavata TaxID=95742 RepID=A0A9Q9DR44_CURCL|nr:mnd1-like protein [Curvularia clavata]